MVFFVWHILIVSLSYSCIPESVTLISKFFEEQKERQDKAAVSTSFLIYSNSSTQPEEHTANNAFGCYHIHQQQQQ